MKFNTSQGCDLAHPNLAQVRMWVFGSEGDSWNFLRLTDPDIFEIDLREPRLRKSRPTPKEIATHV